MLEEDQGKEHSGKISGLGEKIQVPSSYLQQLWDRESPFLPLNFSVLSTVMGQVGDL